MALDDQTLWFLKSLETDYDLLAPLKDEIQSLVLKTSFLKVLFGCDGMWQIEDGNLKALLTRISDVAHIVSVELVRLWSDMNQISTKQPWGLDMGQMSSEGNWSMPTNLDGMISSMLEKLELLKPDLQEVYTILSKSTRSITGMTDVDAVMKLLEYLLENMERLLMSKADLVVPVKEELEAVAKSLRFLRNFLGFTAKGCSKLGKFKDLQIHAEAIVDSASCLLYLCSTNNKMDDQRIMWMKAELLSHIQRSRPVQPQARKIYLRALKASKSPEGNSPIVDELALGFLDSILDCMLELSLSDNKMGSVIPIKDQILSLHGELLFLKDFAIDSVSTKDPEFRLQYKKPIEQTKALINEAGCVIYSLYGDEKKEDMAEKQNSEVFDLLSMLETTKQDLRKIYCEAFPNLSYNFPKTNGQGFISFIVQNLREVLISKAASVDPLKHEIEAVQKELLSTGEDFRKFPELHWMHEELEVHWRRFVELAYQTEYDIDLFIAKSGALCCHKLRLLDIIKEIETIRTDLKSFGNKMADDSSMQISSSPSQASFETFPKNDAEDTVPEEMKHNTRELVVFVDEAKKIKEQLTSGSQKLEVLSIVGMPGIGKTTLANSVFQHYSVICHFHVRASSCVSQIYDRKRLFLEILEQVTGQIQQHMNDEDLEQKLYQSLKGRRYLIFLDDIWDFGLWDDTKLSFPDEGNGSRIIFTSRYDSGNIALVGESERVAYHLSPLSDDKSWEMLRFKLFGKGKCPQKLKKVGQEIATNCKGLPLTVNLIAGVLRVTEKKKESWQEVAKSFVTQLVDNLDGWWRKAVELSYHHLPNYLKSCFLYFAAFPKDTEIRTTKLLWLWVAEGFVQPQKVDDQRSFEDIAEAYLTDLIARNLIIISRRGPLGDVEASRVHDLLHDFAIAKAKEDSFVLQIGGHEKFYTVSSTGFRWCEQYRLCINRGWEEFFSSGASGPRVRSLISSCSEMFIRYKFPKISLKYALLRVLDLVNLTLYSCCGNLFKLVHLRYLSIRVSDAQSVLPEIHHLQNLETFLFVQPVLRDEFFLEHICGMVKLRHFCYDIFDLSRQRSREVLEKFQLDNLQTLATPVLHYVEDTEKILRRMPNLKDLTCYFSGSIDISRKGFCFPKLEFLEKLYYLHVGYRGDVPIGQIPYPCKFNFPSSLKILVLEFFRLPWCQISELGNLENLESLELRNGAFQGPTWDMIDENFPKLKYLILENLDIEEWNASEDHFPCLERLDVHKCLELKELPSCLAYVATLQEIRLRSCGSTVKISAININEEREQTGNEQFTITAHREDYP